MVNVWGAGLISRTADSTTAYYMYNGHGDVTALINASGTIIATYYYDSFGNITSSTGTADNPFKYAGYRHDNETGLYYLMARYYDPVTARFLSEDTFRGNNLDPLSLNLYTYCNNNPIIYVDPSGHSLIGLVTSIVSGLSKISTSNKTINKVANAVKDFVKKSYNQAKEKVKNQNRDIDTGGADSNAGYGLKMQWNGTIVKTMGGKTVDSYTYSKKGEYQSILSEFMSEYIGSEYGEYLTDVVSSVLPNGEVIWDNNNKTADININVRHVRGVVIPLTLMTLTKNGDYFTTPNNEIVCVLKNGRLIITSKDSDQTDEANNDPIIDTGGDTTLPNDDDFSDYDRYKKDDYIDDGLYDGWLVT